MSAPQTLFGPQPRERRGLRIFVMLLAVALFACVAGQNALQYWRQEALAALAEAERQSMPPTVLAGQPKLPDWAASLDDRGKLEEAGKRASTATDDALAVYLNLAKNAGTEESRAQANLYAAALLLHKKSQKAAAEELYRYFLAHYVSQQGTDRARYDLALLLIEKQRYAEALHLLTALWAETPQSPFAASAAAVAQQTGLALRFRESEANYAVADTVRSLLPTKPMPLVLYAAMVVLPLIFSIIDNPEKRRRKSTWVLICLIVMASLTNFLLNQKQDKETAPKVTQIAYSQEPAAR